MANISPKPIEKRWHRARQEGDVRDSSVLSAKPFSKSSVVMAAIALITAVLPIYGYFVMVGVADALHLDAGLLWGSTFDVFHFAFLGFVGMTTWLPNDPWTTFWRLLLQPVNFLLMGYATVMVWVMVSADRSPAAIHQRRQAWLNSAPLRGLKTPVLGLSLYKWFLVPLSALIFPMALLAVWVGVLFFSAIVLFSVLFGMAGGRSYVDLVQSSQVCEPNPANRKISSDSEKAASCVQVQWWADGKQFEVSGFLMASTSTYVLLQNRDLRNQQIKRIPLSTTTVVTTLGSFTSAKHSR